MARAKEFDEEQVLGAAMRLFWKKGYSATSVQDLEEAMGLLRTSIYNAFGNKRTLFKTCLSLYVKQIEETLAEIAAAAPTAREAVARWHERVIRILTDPETPGGCLVVFSVFEGAQHDPETKEMAAALFAHQSQVLGEALEKGVASGELAQDLDLTGTVGAVSAATWGLVVLAAAGFPAEQLRESARAALGLLD